MNEPAENKISDIKTGLDKLLDNRKRYENELKDQQILKIEYKIPNNISDLIRYKTPHILGKAENLI